MFGSVDFVPREQTNVAQWNTSEGQRRLHEEISWSGGSAEESWWSGMTTRSKGIKWLMQRLHHDGSYYCMWLECFVYFSVQKKSMEDILRQNVEKDREIASLKAELVKISQKSPVQPKTKRGLLANIREAVTSPRKGTSVRTLRKTVRTTHRWKAQNLDKRRTREIPF